MTGFLPYVVLAVFACTIGWVAGHGVREPAEPTVAATSTRPCPYCPVVTRPTGCEHAACLDFLALAHVMTIHPGQTLRYGQLLVAIGAARWSVTDDADVPPGCFVAAGTDDELVLCYRPLAPSDNDIEALIERETGRE